MFTPLKAISFKSIYNGANLPARMAKCTPDTYTALFALRGALRAQGADLVLSDLFRSYDMQFQANLDWRTKKKKAYSPPPGGSLHEAGRAFDLDLDKLRPVGLSGFWTIAKAEGVLPIIDQPNTRLSEAWHFSCRGSHQLVMDYYAAGKGDNFKRPYTAMAASAIIAIGQKVDALGDDVHAAYVQSGLIRLGHDIGDLDGSIGPKTRAVLSALQIDPAQSTESLAEAVDQLLQSAFPQEFFIQGAYASLDDDIPAHLIV